MVEFKQDMPPAGGYAPIQYERIPIKKGLSAVTKLGIWIGVTAAGLLVFFNNRERINNQRIEMRCARLALRPMLEAEVDRMYLKQLKRNRDAEERIMKDVEGWEVGKWKKTPVYLSLGPDDYFRPNEEEYFAHTDKKLVFDAIRISREPY